MEKEARKEENQVGQGPPHTHTSLVVQGAAMVDEGGVDTVSLLLLLTCFFFLPVTTRRWDWLGDRTREGRYISTLYIQFK